MYERENYLKSVLQAKGYSFEELFRNRLCPFTFGSQKVSESNILSQLELNNLSVCRKVNNLKTLCGMML